MAATVDPLEARLLPSGSIRIGLIVPVSGVLGLMGPCAINCAVLASEEVNARGGVLGRPVELVLIDGGRPAGQVAAEVAGLVRSGTVQGVAGAHASDVRVAVVAAIAGRVPFVYAPPYEGGGRAPGVYFLGETPDRQLAPGIERLAGPRRRDGGTCSATTTSGRAWCTPAPAGGCARRARRWWASVSSGTARRRAGSAGWPTPAPTPSC